MEHDACRNIDGIHSDTLPSARKAIEKVWLGDFEKKEKTVHRKLKQKCVYLVCFFQFAIPIHT